MEVNTVTVEGYTFEVVRDDIGYFVKYGGKPVKSFHKRKPEEQDLKECIALVRS